MSLLCAALALCACGSVAPSDASSDAARPDAPRGIDALGGDTFAGPDAPNGDGPAAPDAPPANDTGPMSGPDASDVPPPPPPPSDGGACAYPPTILAGFTPRRTLYVAPGGSDSANGMSMATAWATIAHASALQPGDEVRVAPGTYGCPVLNGIRGTAAAPIHIVASGGPRTAVLDCGGTGAILMANLQYVAFDGLEIRNSAAGAHCINLNSGGGPPFTNLSEHVLFVNDYIHNCGLSAFKCSQTFEIELRDCELAHNTAAGNPLIDFVGSHDDRIIGCDVHDSVSEGIQVKGGAYNCLIEANRIHNVASSAINLGQSTGQSFFLPGYTDWEASHTIAANNLIYGNVHAGIAVWGCDHCVVAHNTMYASGVAQLLRGLPTTNGTGASIHDVGLLVQDNIFATIGLPADANNIVPPNDMGLVENHNLWFGTGGSFAGVYSDTPIGPGDTVGMDPRFVNTTTPDLHLAAGSPALGAGVAVPGVTRDFTGACRTRENLGAY